MYERSLLLMNIGVIVDSTAVIIKDECGGDKKKETCGEMNMRVYCN